ncbi:ELWxxDGT repeat protein [Luteolibacter soli]|uniref:ELWxxDGT repeat protein n=1 Tax=Luteolibacter soli TaxID=3135280 RepID=A0ABU9AXN2_9BACT
MMRSRLPLSYLHRSALLTSALALAITATPDQARAQLQTARLIKDANTLSPNTAYNPNITWASATGSQRVVFPMQTFANGTELWVTDGKAKGTRLLKDLIPGPGSSSPQQPTSFGTGTTKKTALLVNRVSTGDQIWITDGTEAGTTRLLENSLPGYQSSTNLLVGTPAGFFFEEINSSRTDDSHELFFSDGTVAGTRSLNPLASDHHTPISDPSAYATATGDSWCYFVANDKEVWRSNGTVAGTTKITTFTTGTPISITVAADRLFITSQLSAGGLQLFVCPIAGGDPVKVGPPDATTWNQMLVIALHDDAFFIAVDGSSNRTLWTSDGTAAGTRRITLMSPDQTTESKITLALNSWKDAIYFSTYHNDIGYELWRTDGTTAGTFPFRAFPPPDSLPVYTDMREFGDSLYFDLTDPYGFEHLWRTRGTSGSTQVVGKSPAFNNPYGLDPLLTNTDTAAFFITGQVQSAIALSMVRSNGGATQLTKSEKSNSSGVPLHPAEGAPFDMLNGLLLAFVKTGLTHELWQMNPDGSKSKAIWKVPTTQLGIQGSVSFRGHLGSSLLFTVDNPGAKHQVWITDGTKKGTLQLADTGSGYAADFVKAGSNYYFAVNYNDEAATTGLWKTNGTPAGTSKVASTDGTTPRPKPGELVALGDVAYALTGPTLWRSDGTAAGTVALKSDWYGQSTDAAAYLSVVAGKLHFTVKTGTLQYLWQSDGTAAGTVAVTPAVDFDAGSMGPAFDLGGAAIFQGDRIQPAPFLWRLDATGTAPVAPYVIGRRVNYWITYSDRQVVAGNQFFYCGIQDGDAELWATDGTANGTRLVKNIYPGTASTSAQSSNPAHLVAAGNLVYFTATDEEHGTELWRSDGTEAGTVLVSDIDPGPESSNPQALRVLGSKLYFTANRRTIGRELYSVDLP